MTAAGFDRLPCQVPGCGRTAPIGAFPACSEWICGRHYRQVPRWLKRERLRTLNEYRRAWTYARYCLEPHPITKRPDPAAARTASEHIWDAQAARVRLVMWWLCMVAEARARAVHA